MTRSPIKTTKDEAMLAAAREGAAVDPAAMYDPDPMYVARPAAHDPIPSEYNPPHEFENVRAEVLLTAEQLVNGDRNASYGDPNQDFQRTASFWNEYLCGVVERKLGAEDGEYREGILDVLCNLIDPHDVGQMMTLLKISRSTVSPGKLDHYIDAAGYQACAAHCADGARK